MGKYKVEISETALKELSKHKKAGNKSINNKIQRILLELEDNPYVGEGQPEPLKYGMNGFWSRRINREHRIIYHIEEPVVTVYVVSAMGHYDGK